MEIPCKTDPRAPHGFMRNASHSEDRYVCECEYWEPPADEEDPFLSYLATLPKVNQNTGK